MKKAYLAVLIVLFLAAARLQAGQCPFGGEKPKSCPAIKSGCRIGLILKSQEALALDPNQIQKLEALKDETKGQLKAAAQAVKAKKDALNELTQSGASEADIRAAAVALGTALGDQAVLKASLNAKINAILTAEQKVKLDQLKEENKGKCCKGKGKGEGMKGPGQCRMDSESAFTKMDADGNGAVSLEEFKAHMEQMKERFGGRGQEGRRGCDVPPPPPGDESPPPEESQE